MICKLVRYDLIESKLSAMIIIELGKENYAIPSRIHRWLGRSAFYGANLGSVADFLVSLFSEIHYIDLTGPISVEFNSPNNIMNYLSGGLITGRIKKDEQKEWLVKKVSEVKKNEIFGEITQKWLVSMEHFVEEKQSEGRTTFYISLSVPHRDDLPDV